MKHFAIFFNDLTQEAQDRYCKELGITKDEGNFEFIPIAIIDMEVKKEIKKKSSKKDDKLSLDDAL